MLKLTFVGLLLVNLFVPIKMSSSMNTFFPEINGNLTKITWAHAVNSQADLNKNLKDNGVMMLEADVVYGKLNGVGDDIPIMGHPPANTSDLSLKAFLDAIQQFNAKLTDKTGRKGAKLDFKSTIVFQESLKYIAGIYDQMDFPIWINADIISGPVNPSSEPVDPDVFFSNAKQFSKSILSLGWTTDVPLLQTNVSYSDLQIKEMINYIQKHDVKQEITFAVRATITANSFEQMVMLREQVKNSTITIWSSNILDVVDIEKLRRVIFDYGVDNVFIDVPSSLLNKLNLGELNQRSNEDNNADGMAGNVKPSFVLMMATVILVMALFKYIY